MTYSIELTFDAELDIEKFKKRLEILQKLI